MRLVKEEFGDGNVGVGMIGLEQEEEEDEQDDEEEGEEEKVAVVEVLPRMSSI